MKLVRAASLCLLAVSCGSVEVRSDRAARIYYLGSHGMEYEGDVRPGDTKTITRLLPGGAPAVGALAAGHYGFQQGRWGGAVLFEEDDWKPLSDLTERAFEGDIEVGMTEEEVLFAWGRPVVASEHTGDPSNKTLEYERNWTIYLLVFRKNRLESWSGHHVYLYDDFCW